MSQKYIEVSGKTIEDAVAEALKTLNMDRDSVSVEILEKPKSGFLGIGAVPAKIRVSYEYSRADKTRDFLEELFKKMNVEAKIDIAEEEEGRLKVTLSGDEMGLVIGRRGENLDALQYITNLSVNKNEDERVRVSIDTENYREKREESLERLAKRVADKVAKYGRSVSLEPMPPSERRIIHACLQDYKGVTTFSTGSEPQRRVIVAPADAKGKKEKETKK
ncbi:MAG: protein jag [Clostridia bacterium]|nr:protein jag [Clostridia bacterium]